MDRIGSTIKTGSVNYYSKKSILVLISSILVFLITASLVQTASGTEGSNYTALLTTGQTPYQLGPFLRAEGFTGWSWWDTASIFGDFHFGTDVQKNLIALMVLDNSTGTIRSVTGLVTPPAFPQVTRRNHSINYSYKADTTDPTITYRWDSTGTVVVYAENNYEDNVDLWMIKELDLRGVDYAALTFWTWYVMETDWDYGYILVSTDGGNSWTNLQGTLTTNTNPNGNNLGNGITGSSNGWVQETMYLTPYAGNKILLGFRFKSDTAVNEEGWYVDDISISSGATNILSDDAETPTIIRTLRVNVTYPHLTLINITDPLTDATTLQYDQHVQQVDLKEDIRHPGTYTGYFKYNPRNEQYAGNYTVILDTTINGTQVAATAQFQTTIFGCQSCHNKRTDINGTNSETSFVHMDYGGLPQFCTYVCHSGSRGFYWSSPPNLYQNPMHVHEMLYGHRGGFPTYYPPVMQPYDVPAHVPAATCTQCHTNFLHDNAGTDTAKIASYTLYGKNISFSSGTHINLTCEDCHGDLSYPAIPQDQYQLQGVLGDYNPSFTSHESFTDTYIIAVNGTENLNFTITADNTTRSVSLYTIGPLDNTTTGLQTNPFLGTRSLATPINMNIGNPYPGTWMIKIIQMQEGIINYTVSSNYPIQRKTVIRIPECNSCHNPTASGKALTKYEIPGWNPGFAHADIDSDGTPDIQCRMCHNSMHNITVKGCQNCHTNAPVNHPISEPLFTQYTQGQCLTCHGDTHNVTAAGDACIECHGTNYTGESPSVSQTFVNISAFNESIHQNINSTPPATLNNVDCWSCHYDRDMDRQSVMKCSGCHMRPSRWHGNADITMNLSELW